MAKRKDPSDKIIDAALKLAATRGWRELALADIATAAKVPLPELGDLFASKSAILAAWSARIDAEVLKLAEDEDMSGESARDRLFDVLMLRLDAMTPQKPALIAIARDLRRDPVAALSLITPMLQAFGWMLEAAGIDSSGLRGSLRVRGLALIWSRVLPVWLADGEDMAKTMAELDRRLRQAEDLLNAVVKFRNRRDAA
ncbi:MAG: TetR family transcriptional regulator [Parvibaculaceae bacterium]